MAHIFDRRPNADRELATREAMDLVMLIGGASEVSVKVLRTLLEAQETLLAKLGPSKVSGLRRALLGELIVEQLTLLVQEADAVPAAAFEKIVAARYALEAVQLPEERDAAARLDTTRGAIINTRREPEPEFQHPFRREPSSAEIPKAGAFYVVMAAAPSQRRRAR